jgi:hypothetical protein
VKKGLYIFIIGLGLVATSCQKQEIVPNSDDEMAVPAWTDLDDNARGSNPGGANGEEGSDITDPNNPTEGSDNKGKG